MRARSRRRWWSVSWSPGVLLAALVLCAGLAGCGSDECACDAADGYAAPADAVPGDAGPADAGPGDAGQDDLQGPDGAAADGAAAPCTPAGCAPTYGLPEGVEAFCEADGAGGERCAFRLVPQSEVVTNLLRIWRGAAVYYGYRERLDETGAATGCVLPDSQAVTPVEGTCCEALGGPDSDGDDRCDRTSTYFDTETWADLGIQLGWTPHRYVYAFLLEGNDPAGGAWTAAARGRTTPLCSEAPDCEHVFTVSAAPREAGSCLLTVPAALTHALEGDCPPGAGASLGALPLDPHLRDGLELGAWLPWQVDSLAPRWFEAVTSLEAIVTAAAAAFEASPPGACAFPPAAPVTPAEGTCCQGLGGPDGDGDGLCERAAADWQTPAWQALGFAPAARHGLVFETEERTVGGERQFVARAYADLDCDNLSSTFARFVRVTGTEGACEAEVIPGVHTVWESE